MELETINKLYLELSQFATAKTKRELELESKLMDESKANVLRVLMYDKDKGWAEISSGLTQDFSGDSVTNSFNVQFKDRTERRVSFSIKELTQQGGADE